MEKNSFNKMAEKYGVVLAFELFCSQNPVNEITRGIMRHLSLHHLTAIWDRLPVNVQPVVLKELNEINALAKFSFLEIVKGLNTEYVLPFSWGSYLFRLALKRVQDDGLSGSQVKEDTLDCPHIFYALGFVQQEQATGNTKSITTSLLLESPLVICHACNILYTCVSPAKADEMFRETIQGNKRLFSPSDNQVIFTDQSLSASFLYYLKNFLK